MSGFVVRDLGTIEYMSALAIQRETLESVISGESEDTLLLLEHPPTLSLGANFHSENLLHVPSWYAGQGIAVVESDRGGDVTYHGPGQLVAYPIFSLGNRGKDLHLWLRELEGVVISTLKSFNLEGLRFPPHTGVWVGPRKICAMGIKVRKWVSMHGVALNCANDLAPFESIIPCGIQGYGVTSVSAELDVPVSVEDVKPVLVRAFQEQLRSLQ